MSSILFVCTGNTCRSPMAEGILKHLLKEKKANNIQVHSAGIIATDGLPASTGAILTMAEMGIDISSHKATKVRSEILRTSDLIVVMEWYHKDAILYHDPTLEDKIKLLKEFSDASPVDMDIPDPIGGTLDQYRSCAVLIKQCIQRMVDEKLLEKD